MRHDCKGWIYSKVGTAKCVCDCHAVCSCELMVLIYGHCVFCGAQPPRRKIESTVRFHDKDDDQW